MMQRADDSRRSAPDQALQVEGEDREEAEKAEEGRGFEHVGDEVEDLPDD
ncbi:unnamed protein product [Linum tenue]|uniref:Uncharacterized protein n=1 Tax=Linum tenue TaxID=586396 RepID=A0AAV0GWK6_9ROSI|nr:unnamed protein product [Linum tenue]